MFKPKSGAALVLLFLAAVCLPAPAAPSSGAGSSTGVSFPTFSIEVLPLFGFPIGAGAPLFSFGAGAELAAAWKLPPVPFVFVGGELGYTYQATSAPGTSLSLGTIGAQAGVNLRLTQALSARLFGDAGWFAAGFNESGSSFEGNPYFGGGLAAGFDLSRNFTLGAGARYRYYGGLVGSLLANLGATYKFAPRAGREKALPPGLDTVRNDGRGLKLAGVRLESVFPVFFKHYDDHPIGTAILRNYEDVPAQDLRVSLMVKQYMDNPKDCSVPVRLAPGRDGEVVLYGLFTDKILEVAEATKLSLNLTVQYRQYGRTVRDEYIQTLGVFDRNALTWSDDRKAAAFASARDPHAVSFARGVAVATKDVVKAGIIGSLQSAIAIHEALLLDNITYVQDPVSALTTNNREVVDFIQYPQQTLEFRAGKCGDLTVLYCAIMESIGIPTALITVPGHILMAFDLQVPEADARQIFSRPEDLIIREGKVWLPIETTIRTGHFLDAWEEGVSQWKAGTQQNTAAFYPVRDAWMVYNPVVFSGKPSTLLMPDRRKIADAFKSSLGSFVNRELGPRVADLQRQIKQSGSTAQLLNRLGVLYARFGDLEKAEEQFTAVLKKQDTTAGLLNIGNIYYLRGKYAEALAYYNRALKKSPAEPKALLALSRTYAAMERFTEAQQTFAKLTSVDPALAERFAFLGGGASDSVRAASVQETKGDVLWQD
jgi:hypothetical protein